MHISTVTPKQLKTYLASLPVDEEPLGDDDIAAIEAGERALARGDVVSGADIARILQGESAPVAEQTTTHTKS